MSVTESRTDFGGVVTSDPLKWFGGAVASDGKIYCAPAGSTGVLVIDPTDDTAVLNGYGLGLTSDSGKFAGVVQADDGRLYCIPRHSDEVLIIDPVAGTASLTDFGLDLPGVSFEGSHKWIGGARAHDGKIYCAPYNANTVLVIDPSADTAVLDNFGVPSLADSGAKFAGAVLGLDGKIYCPPRAHDNCFVIDPAAGTAELTNFGIDLSTNAAGSGSDTKWTSGLLGGDGKLYFGPRAHVADVLVVDTGAGTAERKDWGLDLANFNGIAPVNGADGRLWFLPTTTVADDATTAAFVVDPVRDSAEFTTVSDYAASDKHAGAVLAGNGKIYAIPRTAPDCLIVAPDTATPLDDDVVRSPWLSRY